MGRVPSGPPNIFGGNMDNRDLGPGSTLYLPVHVPGALLSLGDGHAAQGHGEVCLSAIETSMQGEIQVALHKGKRILWPRAETPTHYMTMGLHTDLDEAAKIATREMLDWLVEMKGLTREDAYMLASLAMDLVVTQVVDITKGIHALQPPFSQGTLCNFRMRLMAHNLDKTLLDRTVTLAEQTGGFGARQLRAALDSTPLFGAARVEDTLNLLGHALRKAVGLVAQALGTSVDVLLEEAGLTLVGHSSLKAALDLNWGAPGRAAQFPASACDACPRRAQCTTAKLGQGRTLTIRADEQCQQQLRAKLQTQRGRASLRKRTAVEHTISHHVAHQGRRARYKGLHKNQFDGRRHAAVSNLQVAAYYEEQQQLAS